jgi:hypothetical protein
MFQGVNEYMTFQQILSFPRDYIWPVTIDDLSKTFICHLLKQNVNERIGMSNYDDIKQHMFFRKSLEDENVIWGGMQKLAPPPQLHRRILSEPKYDGANPAWMLEDIKDDMDSAINAESMDLNVSNGNGIGNRHLSRLSSEILMTGNGEQSNIVGTREDVDVGNWNAFLRKDERVVMSGLVGKKNRAWVTRKRYLLLIEGGIEPRFVYIAPDRLIVKGDIAYHESMSVELKTTDRWTLNIPGRTFLWMCLDNTDAKTWVDSVLGVLSRAK